MIQLPLDIVFIKGVYATLYNQIKYGNESSC